jgi:hypothetical protein
MPIWDKYPDFTADELRTLVAVTAQVLLESDEAAGAVPEDLLDLPAGATARELAAALGTDSAAVRALLDDDARARQAALRVLGEVRGHPALAARIAVAYEARGRQWRRPRMSRLTDLVSVLVSTAPGVAAMRGRPYHEDWGAKLAEHAAAPGLEPLRPLLAAMTDDALRTLAPLNRFLAEEAAKQNPSLFGRAAQVAEGAADEAPQAAFVLALIATLGWAAALDRALLAQQGGMPHPGWLRLPYVLARASTNLGGNIAAIDLIDLATEVLSAAKHVSHPALRAALEDYRRLAGRAARRAADAAADLAEDLRAATRPSATGDMRAEIGALLWTLGYVPESTLLSPAQREAPTLSRRFYRRIVEQSLATIPHDPLVQYVWLAMKDRAPLDLRAHGEIFGRINMRYAETLLDQALAEPPSQIYARTAIAWFRGDIDRAGAIACLQSCELVSAQFPNCDWLLLLRTQALARMVARRFDLLAPGSDEADFRARMAALAADLRRSSALHPEWPPLGNRASVASFLAVDAARAGAPEAVLDALEPMREAALVYWLATVPPPPAAGERAAIAAELAEEEKLLGWLRGAFFMILSPILPMHYRRYGVDLAARNGSAAPIDPDAGRAQFREIREELATLHGKMAAAAPDYAARRREPRPDLAELTRLLGAHARPAATSPARPAGAC